MFNSFGRMAGLFLVLMFFTPVQLQAEIQPEPMGIIKTLPSSYPERWIIVQDGAFFHMSDGKFMVIDANSDDQWGRFKGMFNGASIPHFYQSRLRPEMYITESFLARGNRGERTDFLTVYDKRTLSPIHEIEIPAKRSSNMPTHFNLQLVDNENYALIYNFTPATSVSVVDMQTHKFLHEISIPGCGLVYPMSGRAFASMCSDGSMISTHFGEDGKQTASDRTQPFFDVNKDPLMEKAIMIEGVAYFPSFSGQIYPIDLNGDKPVIGETWSLTEEQEADWRPGGILVGNSDSSNRMYILMHPEGYDGSHKDPGSEVWVFDPLAKKRIDRIAMQVPALSIAFTRDKTPLLVATNINMEIDVYDTANGKHLRTIGNFGQETPFLLHGAR